MVDELPQNVFLMLDHQMIPITKLSISMGRNVSNDLIIAESTISREHARIEYENGEFVLYDLGSTHGTFLNGQKVEQEVLKSGDTIYLAVFPVLFIDRSDAALKNMADTTGALDS